MDPVITKKTGFYAVKRGRQRGIFHTWSDCLKQTRGYPKSCFKKFVRREDAEDWLYDRKNQLTSDKKLVCYSDGSCINNGTENAHAGIGVWFGPDDRRNISEKLPGERQTNQRAEIYAAIRAIEVAGSHKHSLKIFTDSNYVVQAVNKWIPDSWLQKDFEGVANEDLFRRLWSLIESCSECPEFIHIPGHGNIEGNEYADELARRGAKTEPLPFTGIGGLKTGPLFGST